MSRVTGVRLGDQCPCSHRPTGPSRAVAMIRMLYGLGFGYHEIADLTLTHLNHAQMRELMAIPDLEQQARLLAYLTR